MLASSRSTLLRPARHTTSRRRPTRCTPNENPVMRRHYGATGDGRTVSPSLIGVAVQLPSIHGRQNRHEHRRFSELISSSAPKKQRSPSRRSSGPFSFRRALRPQGCAVRRQSQRPFSRRHRADACIMFRTRCFDPYCVDAPDRHGVICVRCGPRRKAPSSNLSARAR